MSKFTLFKEVAEKEKQAKSKLYQDVRRQRYEELVEMVAQVDLATDRRRTRKIGVRRNVKTSKPFNLPPKGYIRIRDAAKLTGFSLSTLKPHIANGRLPAQKFSRSIFSNQQVWYLSENTCNELKERKSKGLGPVPSVFIRTQSTHGKGTKHV